MATSIRTRKKAIGPLVSLLVAAIVIFSSLYLGMGNPGSGSFQIEQNSHLAQNRLAPLQAPSSVNGSYAGYVEWTLLLNNTLINGNYQGNVSRVGSGPMLFDPLNGFIYLSDTLTGNVTVVNALANRVVLNLSGLSYPGAIVLDTSDNFLYVADGGSISVINASSNKFVGNLTVGTLVGGIALDPSNHYLYVTEYGMGSVLAIDTKTGNIMANISVGDDPSAIYYDPSNGYVYVSHDLPIIIMEPAARYETHSNAISLGYNNSSNLVVINSLTNSIIQNVSVGSHVSTIARSPTTGMVYVVDAFGYIVALNPTNDSIVSNITVGDNLGGISFDTSSGYIYVTSSPFVGGTVITENSTGNIPGNGSYVFVLNSSSDQVVSKILVDMAPSGIAYVPAKESFYVSDGAISIISTEPGYKIEFRESGLPVGIRWSTIFDSSRNTSSSSEINYTVSNGTYVYSISSFDYNYAPSLASGNVTVNGSAIVMSVTFINTSAAKSYLVTFNETGLSLGSMWYVTLNGTTKNSTSSEIIFAEPNGTYSFHILPPSGITTSPTSGLVSVRGSNVTESIHFTSAIPKTYSVIFSETGLPPGSSWSVTLNETTQSSTGNITFILTNGTYLYSIAPVPGYSILLMPEYNGSSGIITVNGYNLSYPVTFSEVTSNGYLVGSISPSNVSILINGAVYHAINGQFNISLSPGTYEVKVSAPGYSAYTTNITIFSSSVSKFPIKTLTKVTGPTSYSFLYIIAISIAIVIAIVVITMVAIKRNRIKKS